MLGRGLKPPGTLAPSPPHAREWRARPYVLTGNPCGVHSLTAGTRQDGAAAHPRMPRTAEVYDPGRGGGGALGAGGRGRRPRRRLLTWTKSHQPLGVVMCGE